MLLSVAGTWPFTGTWFLYTGAFFVAVGFLLYYFSISTYGYWRKRNVPHDRPVPLLGNFSRMLIGLEHQTEFFGRLYKQSAGHKYWGFYQMRTPTLMLRDPELIAKVLVKDFWHFSDHGFPVDIDATPITNHMFTMKGQKWKIIRAKISPVFTSSKLKNMREQIKDCGDQLMNNLQLKLAQSDVLEVRGVIGDYSMDVIGTCAFGLQLNTIVDDNSLFRKAGRAVFAPSIRLQLKDMCEFISPGLRKMLKINDFPKFATDFFEKSFFQTMEYRQKNHITRNDFVQCLLQARTDLVINKSEPSVSYKEMDIIANAFLMFVAGFETVSTTVSFCLYELALKKHIQDRVREEILTAKSNHDDELNSGFLAELPYLEMVLAETLRMYPPLTLLIRETSKSYQVPGEDLVIEKGTKIAIPAYSLHMDPMYYTDPVTFNPERFTPEEKAKRPSGVYMPFGEGPRLCLGKRFAEMEMKLALSEILSKYEVEPCEKTDAPMKFKKLTLTTVPENGIWLKFKSLDS
ncbi:probable cytochrome P450 6a14 [Adelges cooleyi]|uniref:probable cytochrome P450 6a14 n=1 Tax=Adelges cooleyi TaxID=133065 RepID=UPI00217FB76D|nr:probable cytochrome P450 6a14 [Adelges cooleyi]